MIVRKAEDVKEITKDNLPSLYHIASDVSIDKKKNFLRLIQWNLILLVVGALSSSFNLPQTDQQGFFEPIRTIITWISFISLAASIFLTIFLQIKGYEKEWYGARAIAESMKTLAWRFMMCSDKFDKQIRSEDVKQLFINELNDIRNQSKYLAGVLSGEIADKPLITDFMLEVRQLNIKDRLQIYLKHRIGKQKTWYTKNAKENENTGNNFFVLIYIAQITALVFTFFYAMHNSLFFNPSGVFATLAASFLTWAQVKQFKTLSQSYSYTAHELNSIYTLGQDIAKEDDLSKFIVDSEQAISREHTMWMARKVEQ